MSLGLSTLFSSSLLSTVSTRLSICFLDNESPYLVPACHPYVAASNNVFTAALAPGQSLCPECTMRNRDPLNSYSISMAHLELFNNIYSKEFTSIEEPEQHNNILDNIYIK